MRIPKLLVLSALAGALWAGPAVAVDAPHDGSFSSGSCDSCHKLHASAGGTLTSYSSNNLACVNCHEVSEPNVPGNRFAMPWAAGDQAVPGVSGAHHNWGAAAVNATYGTVVPPAPMGTYVKAGLLECGTCHDPHPSNKANTGARQVSLATGTALAPTAGTGGTAPTMTLTVAAGTVAAARGYLVRIVQYTSTTSFKVLLSNDFGKAAPAWLKWNGTGWVAATGASDTSGTAQATATSYSLNDGANVSVVFGGTALAASLEWKFYVSYPFLRVSNVADANGMCVQCHGNRVMGHTCVDGSTCTADGAKVFSHPVGEALGTNTAIGDATVATMLDADGSAQNGATPDANKTNDMVLGTGGVVGCLSCHAPHNTDSNSLTVDAR